MDKIENLRGEIARREAELADLKSQLAAAESEPEVSEQIAWPWPLQKHEYERYGRQMIVPNFGIQGQLRLRKARVLLVGAGGLGCPAAAYLAGAGVGMLGLVDGDEVEVSNLHRQVAHSTARVGMAKVDSAVAYLKSLNPSITYKSHHTHLTPQNANAIVSQYDLVLDCTDHPTSRYLISDICVLLAKPLVSASAFQSSGQLIVLNSPPGRGPCYRCVFPRPPPPESVVGCGEGGIVGPVVGVMGVLQALEAIKLVVGGGLEPAVDGDAGGDVKEVALLLFSAMGGTMFRSVRMRGKRKDCVACSEANGLTLNELETSLDYVQFCGVTKPVQLLQPAERITAEEYARLLQAKDKHILLDVREKEHFGLCSIPGSINIPIGRFTSHRKENGSDDILPADTPADAPIYLVCRVGNDSQIAAQKLKDLGLDRGGQRFIGDIKGGLGAWRRAVDPTLPLV